MRLVHRSAVFLTSVFWLVASSLVAQDPVFRPAGGEGKIDPALHGVWASRGYGWIVEVKDATTARFFDDTEVACLPEDVPVEDFLSFVRLFAVAGDTVRITGAHESATVYTFDRIEEVPARCAAAVEATPERTLEHFGALMATHYAFFEQYGIDWPARLASARTNVSAETGPRQLFEVLGELLDGIHDAHLRLIAELDGEREVVRPGRAAVGPMLDRAFLAQRRHKSVSTFQQRWYESQRKQVRKGLLGKSFRSAADGQLVWGRVGRIGYIGSFGMGGFGSDGGTMADEIAGTHAAMARALGDLQDTDALVVDVTMNGGGHDRVSLAIAAHFADEKTLAFTKRAFDAPGSLPQPFYVVPAEVRYVKPVTLLTSQYTVSAAEIFTMAMRALPRVTHRGEATRGALSDVLEKDLVNGWTVTLSNEVYLDAEDVLWEGRGVPPADPIDVFVPATVAESRLRAIRTAIARTEESR